MNPPDAPLDLDALLALEEKAKRPVRFGDSWDNLQADRVFTIAARNALRPLVEELRAERARAKDLYVTLEQIAFGSYTLSGDCADDAKVTLARYDAARAASEKESG